MNQDMRYWVLCELGRHEGSQGKSQEAKAKNKMVTTRGKNIIGSQICTMIQTVWPVASFTSTIEPATA